MQHIFHGEKVSDPASLQKYKTDASVFSILPSIVYYPKNTEDIISLVHLCHTHRAQGEKASLTVRAGGTCMSGGPLSDEWVVDLTRHMTAISIDPEARTATVEMGAYFRDIETAAAEHGLMFAPYPSSRLICGIGGMIGNNASGEKSLRNGPTSDNVLSLEIVLADGSVATLSPKHIAEVTEVRESALLALAQKHAPALEKATGEVKKAASGYRLEKTLTETTFSEIPLVVGAQGTLGIVTKAKLALLPIPEHLDLLIISAQSLEDIPTIIDVLRAHNPEGLETFDINTYKKAEEFLPEQAATLAPFIDPSSHLFILAQFSEDTAEATRAQRETCEKILGEKGYFVRHSEEEHVVQSAWDVRRNSFLLMRDHNAPGHSAVPCIEDIIVPLPTLGIFIKELSHILTKRDIHYGFHGHIGDGSLRIIPVFDFSSPTLVDDIVGLTEEVFALIKSLHGNMSADHSDGIIRTPFLKEFYGEELYSVFEDIKKIYDPQGIMNPKKKVGGTIADITAHLNR